MKVTKQTKQVERLVDKHFPDCPKDFPRAYRYSPASIRVRIVDERFKEMNRSERWKMVMPLIRTLPEDIRQELTVLLLLSPDELSDSLMNREYEKPSPHQL
jgi:hypothetical protein